MRVSYLFCLICLLLASKTWSQNTSENITVSFDSIPLQQAFEKIEDLTNYHFFYVKEWLGNDTFSGQYTNSPVSKVLEDMVQNRTLNFYFLDDQQIIITQNNAIYDELPKAFRKIEPAKDSALVEIESEAAEEGFPVLIRKTQSGNTGPVETFRVGKAVRGQKKTSAKISGYVINAESKEPIPDLQIIVKKLNLAALTSSRGFYEIQLPVGTHILELRALGIENATKRLVVYNYLIQSFNAFIHLKVLPAIIVNHQSFGSIFYTQCA